jgi:hypothetical protein
MPKPDSAGIEQPPRFLLDAALLEEAGSRRDLSRIIIIFSVASTTVQSCTAPPKPPHTTSCDSSLLSSAHGTSLPTPLRQASSRPNLANGLVKMLDGQQTLDNRNSRKRLGEPEDIAGVIVYRASPTAAYVNSVDIAVDGGGRYAAGRQSKL